MSSAPSASQIIQDIAPPGGFAKIDHERFFPKRGLNGMQIWGAVIGTIGLGFYLVGQSNIERNQQKMQERRVRYALAPFLQAEIDRQYVVKQKEYLKWETEIMKDVPGWTVGQSPYFNGKWMPRWTRDFLISERKK